MSKEYVYVGYQGAGLSCRNLCPCPRRCRQFVADWLPQLTAQQPSLEVATEAAAGQHPVLRAAYRSGLERVVSLRNAAPEEVLRQLAYLRGSAGRKAGLQVKQRVLSRQPTVQGHWH